MSNKIPVTLNWGKQVGTAEVEVDSETGTVSVSMDLTDPAVVDLVSQDVRHGYSCSMPDPKSVDLTFDPPWRR